MKCYFELKCLKKFVLIIHVACVLPSAFGIGRLLNMSLKSLKLPSFGLLATFHGYGKYLQVFFPNISTDLSYHNITDYPIRKRHSFCVFFLNLLSLPVELPNISPEISPTDLLSKTSVLLHFCNLKYFIKPTKDSF